MRLTQIQEGLAKFERSGVMSFWNKMKLGSVLACLLSVSDLVAGVSDGLIAYYPLNDTTADLSGQNHHGIGTNVFAATDRFGITAHSLSFSNASVAVPDSIPLRLSNSDFTLSIWVYETDRNSSYNDCLISKRGSQPRDGWFLSLLGNASAGGFGTPGQVFFNVSGGGDPYTLSSSVVPLNEWHQIVIVFQRSSTLQIFIDGALDSTGHIPSPNPNCSAALLIGRDSVGPGYYFHGKLDDVRIYGRALSVLEVSELFATESGNLAPQILVQPQSQFSAVGSNLIFSITAVGAAPLSFIWKTNNISIPGETNTALAITNASSLDGVFYSVVVSNALGVEVSKAASLHVLADPAKGIPPQMPQYSSLPPKQTGKDSLIIITHGWEPLSAVPILGWFEDPGWLESMADHFDSYVTNQGYTNWQVVPYRWLVGAETPSPSGALVNGFNEGGKLGRDIVSQGWSHVHLIGHSAGAALVQSALQAIKADRNRTITVHATFLDPFVGARGEWRGIYGLEADWSDSYFSIDLTGPTTEGPISNAFNVDVTWVDPDKVKKTVFCSPQTLSIGPAIPCGEQAFSSHYWPYKFYQSTIPVNGRAPLEGSEGTGFPLSKEGGGWTNRSSLSRGERPRILGGNVSFNQTGIPFRTASQLNVGILPHAGSQSGTIDFPGNGILIQTQPQPVSILGVSQQPGGGAFSDVSSPVWLSTGVTLTQSVNFVNLEADFVGFSGTEGLLSIYWNTNLLGSIDGSVCPIGRHQYSFQLPTVAASGDYVFGIRLDAQSNNFSGVIVTNISFDYVGQTQEITLTVKSTITPAITLALAAAPGFNYLVEKSTNLLSWTPFAVLMNTNGIVSFADPNATTDPRSFYRALLP